ncbi:MAG TPA: aldo/keto reductase [Herpetosiphonaceae bacterium]
MSELPQDTFLLGGDLPVRRLGFGAMQITGPGIWGEPQDRPQALAVLRRALELGVNFIDTADSYGPAISEELIAEALHPYRDGLVIATKGGLMRGGPNNWYPNGHPEYLRGALESSLRRLRLERVDLYQLHRIDPQVPLAESLGVLVDMQREGKIRHLGLSEVNAEELAAARAMATIVSVQNLYNLTERKWEEMIDLCARENIGFIPWFPLATGNLAKPGGPLDTIAQRLGATPSQVALAWLLRRSPAMLPIPGTSKVAHLEQNMGALAVELSDDDLRQLSEAKAE